MSDHDDQAEHNHVEHDHDHSHKNTIGAAIFFGILGSFEIWAGRKFGNPAVVVNGSHNLSEIIFPVSIAIVTIILSRAPLDSHLKCQLPHYVAIVVQLANIVGIGVLAVLLAASHTNRGEMFVGIIDGGFGFFVNHWWARRMDDPTRPDRRANAEHFRKDAHAGVAVAAGGIGAWALGWGIINRLAGIYILVITVKDCWPELMNSVRQIHRQDNHPPPEPSP